MTCTCKPGAPILCAECRHDGKQDNLKETDPCYACKVDNCRDCEIYKIEDCETCNGEGKTEYLYSDCHSISCSNEEAASLAGKVAGTEECAECNGYGKFIVIEGERLPIDNTGGF